MTDTHTYYYVLCFGSNVIKLVSTKDRYKIHFIDNTVFFSLNHYAKVLVNILLIIYISFKFLLSSWRFNFKRVYKYLSESDQSLANRYLKLLSIQRRSGGVSANRQNESLVISDSVANTTDNWQLADLTYWENIFNLRL